MESWPQPREGVEGIDRTIDDLLSLDPAALRRRVVILDIACSLWQATLRGAHGSERGRMAYERMSTPLMGDLVAETVGMSRPTRNDSDGDQRAIHSFGILLGERTEWACTHEKWQEHLAEDPGLTNEDRTTDRVAYVQYGPNAHDICRWVMGGARLHAVLSFSTAFRALRKPSASRSFPAMLDGGGCLADDPDGSPEPRLRHGIAAGGVLLFLVQLHVGVLLLYGRLDLRLVAV